MLTSASSSKKYINKHEIVPTKSVFYTTMRRSFKERGKRLLNKISGDNTAAVAAGEISVATVLQNNVECENLLSF